ADHRRNALEAGLLTGAPAAFTGDDLIAAGGDRADHDRLHHAVGTDRLGEFLEGGRVHVAARLVLATLDHLQRQVLQFAAVGLHGLLFQLADTGSTQQGIQASAQTSFLRGHGNFPYAVAVFAALR